MAAVACRASFVQRLPTRNNDDISPFNDRAVKRETSAGDWLWCCISSISCVEEFNNVPRRPIPFQQKKCDSNMKLNCWWRCVINLNGGERLGAAAETKEARSDQIALAAFSNEAEWLVLVMIHPAALSTKPGSPFGLGIGFSFSDIKLKDKCGFAVFIIFISMCIFLGF